MSKDLGAFSLGSLIQFTQFSSIITVNRKSHKQITVHPQDRVRVDMSANQGAKITVYW